MTAAAGFTSMPYPGLRAFEAEEADIFFGRERQSDQLLATLNRKRFLAVVGPSGCGKSSLVRAGLIAPLRTGFMTDAGSSWKIALFRPGNRPMERLADAVVGSGLLDVANADPQESRLFVEAALRAGPRGLVEVVAEANRPGDNLLVLVDQFEELFRFRASADRDEAEAFVAQLLAATEQQEQRIYVVLTMRSDFLGDCSMFHGLPEAINDGQYLTPRLTREECRMAIVGPAKVFGGQIAGELVNRLLNDFGPDSDRLPVLQHALMRMWQRAAERAAGNTTALGLEDYDDVGGLASALSNHAEEALADLDPAQRHLAEILFKRISERGLGRRDTRAPARLGDVVAVAGREAEDVAAVVEAFRRPDRCFLMPREGRLTADTVIDLSHESLIRQWTTLARWVDEEADSAAIYARLKETAHLWKKGDAGLWGTPDLDRALKWQREACSTEAWASRYGTGEEYELAHSFLTESERARQAEAARREADRLRSLRRARRVALGFGLATLGLAAFVAIYGYLAIFEHKAHFSSFTKRWGAPVGVGPLTAAQIRRRPSSFRVVRKGRLGPVLRLEAVDSEGRPTSNHNVGTYLDVDPNSQESSWEFAYDGAGVVYERARDQRGEPVWGFMYAPAAHGARRRTAYFVGPDGFPRTDKRYDGVVSLTYDDGGLEIERRYYTRSGQPRPGPDHAFGRVNTFDAQGREIAMTSIDREGKPMDDSAGNATMESTLDDLGNPVASTARDAKGAVTWLKEGWAKRTISWDDSGNLLGTAFLDDQGQPTLTKNGYHRAVFRLDERGNRIEERYFGLADDAATDQHGCHAYTCRFDERNRIVAVTCLDALSRPAPNAEGVTTSTFEYNDAGWMTVVTSLDAQGHQVNSTSGYSKRRFQYNHQHKVTETLYLGPSGQPALIKQGYARVVDDYDQRGLQTGRRVFGRDGKPTMAAQGWAGWTQRHDSSGHVLEKNYFRSDGHPATIEDGYAGWRARYDAEGNEVESLYHGERGQPVLCSGGYAGWRADFDSVGNRVRLVYLGTDGQPIIANEGVAGYTSRYDTAANEVERRFFDADDKPTPAREGNAGWSRVYDIRGNQVEESMLDVAGRPAAVPWIMSDPLKGTYTSTKQTFDAQRNVLSVAYFGVYGQPVANTHGWARVEHRYDAERHQVDSAYFGVAGQPVTIDAGFHRVHRTFREQGQDIEYQYLGIDGKPALGKGGHARIRKRMDRFGRLLEQAAFGLKGEPILFAQGFHREIRTLDDRGRSTSERYYDAEGRAVTRREGYHTRSNRHDDRGNLMEVSTFGLDGKPTVNRTTGYARVTYERDPRGDVMRFAYFGIDGRPVVSEGAATIEHTLGPRRWGDDSREIVLTRMLGVDGKPIAQPGGYSQIRRSYDDRGNVIETTFLNGAGRPVQHSDRGYATERSGFDTVGNLTENAFFDVAGRPATHRREGYHKATYKFTETRQVAEAMTFDTRGHLVVNSEGCARFVHSFDKNGKLTSIATYDASGLPTTAKHGYARMTKKYDEFGNQVEEAYYGPSGRLQELEGNVARTQSIYDDHGNNIEMKYFAASNRPASPVARLVRVYDHRRLVTEERLYDARDKPARRGGLAEHIVRREYDAAGNKVAETYFGAHGEKVAGWAPKGEFCVKWSARYDAGGKMLGQTCTGRNEVAELNAFPGPATATASGK